MRNFHFFDKVPRPSSLEPLATTQPLRIKQSGKRWIDKMVSYAGANNVVREQTLKDLGSVMVRHQMKVTQTGSQRVQVRSQEEGSTCPGRVCRAGDK